MLAFVCLSVCGHKRVYFRMCLCVRLSVIKNGTWKPFVCAGAFELKCVWDPRFKYSETLALMETNLITKEFKKHCYTHLTPFFLLTKNFAVNQACKFSLSPSTINQL